MGEPERKRRKYRAEQQNVNPGPGPPPGASVRGSTSSGSSRQSNLEAIPSNRGDDWASFNQTVENLNQYLITRCICRWTLNDYEQILMVSASKFSDVDNGSEILLFSSSIQLLCEEIARQQSVEHGNNAQCRTLKRLRVLLFHVNSNSDPTCLLQHFLRSHNQYVSYAAARALSAWLKAADEGACRVFLDRLLNNIVSFYLT